MFLYLFCHNRGMSNVSKKGYVDPGWPQDVPNGVHPVTELVNLVNGASSPYGDEVIFPRPVEELGYVHPYTRVNR